MYIEFALNVAHIVNFKYLGQKLLPIWASSLLLHSKYRPFFRYGSCSITSGRTLLNSVTFAAPTRLNISLLRRTWVDQQQVAQIMSEAEFPTDTGLKNGLSFALISISYWLRSPVAQHGTNWSVRR